MNALEPEPTTERQPVALTTWIRRGAVLLGLAFLAALIGFNWEPAELWLLGPINAPLSLILGGVSVISAGVGAASAWWWLRRRGRKA